jgi:hypothetical protein
MNHLNFKFEFNSNEFVNYKAFWILETNFFSLFLRWTRTRPDTTRTRPNRFFMHGIYPLSIQTDSSRFGVIFEIKWIGVRVGYDLVSNPLYIAANCIRICVCKLGTLAFVSSPSLHRFKPPQSLLTRSRAEGGRVTAIGARKDAGASPSRAPAAAIARGKTSHRRTSHSRQRRLQRPP